jgi:hypothetical protein
MPVLGLNIGRTGSWTCAHVLCSECQEDSAQDYEDDENINQCPICLPNRIHAAAGDGLGHRSGREGRRDDYFRPQGHSSKMAALIDDVQEGLYDGKRLVAASTIAKFLTWSTKLTIAQYNFLLLDKDLGSDRHVPEPSLDPVRKG